MKFQKEELHFLNLFSVYSDNSIDGDKLKILVEDNTIYFYQSSINIKLVYAMDNVNNFENGEYTFITSRLNSLIKLCKDESIIEIKDDYIIFNDNAKYKIDNYDYNIVHPKELLENIGNDLLSITELNKINTVKPFIGKNSDYNVIAIMDNHFVTYNELVLSFTITNNKIKENQLPYNILPIISYYKLESLDVYNIEDDFIAVNIDNFYAFFEKTKHEIPFIFTDDMKELYEHSNKVVVNTIELKQKLQRINVVSRENIDNKIYISFKDNKIYLETKIEPIGEEIIEAQIDNELNNFYVITYASALLSMVNQIGEENIEIHVTPDKENITTITMKGQEGNTTYVCRLSEYEE